MNYEQIIELDNLTIIDCLSLKEEGIYVEINNGRVTSLTKE